MLTINNFESPTVKSKNTSDGFSGILKEAYEYFAEQNVQMVSGFSDILTEDALFNSYVKKLTNGLDANDASQLTRLLENQRLTTLQESTVSQVSPLAGLAMPTVRKMWVKTALKNAIPTETAKVPSFSISWMNPYIREADGTKKDLPNAIRGKNSLAEQPKVTDKDITLPANDKNLFDDSLTGGKAAAITNHDAVNPTITIFTAVMTVPSGDGTATQDVTVKVTEGKLNVSNMFNASVEAMSLEDDASKRHKVVDTIIGSMNCETGDYTLISIKGLVKSIKFKGTFTHENNKRTTSVSFDINKKDIRIGTGAHIEAPLPIEFLQDSLALYNIDATVESVDLMSQITSQKLDLEIVDFFEDSFITSGSPFIGRFDCKPSAGFAGSPTEWRHELRTTIEWWATKLKSNTLFTQGYFVIIGNPLDVNLIPDINWQFKSVDGERGGVSVNYDFGVLTTNNVYQVVSSDNMEQGKLIMFFCPNTDNYMTYKYYPYTFNIEKGGYINDQMPNVPSIMMTKRHTLEELIPMQVQIEILHNDGQIISNYAMGGQINH